MSLTGGFDLAIAVPESVASRIVRTYWPLLSVPRLIRSMGAPNAPDAIVSITLASAPAVRLRALENAVELGIWFNAGIAGGNYYVEGSGVVSLLMSIKRQVHITVDGKKEVSLLIVPIYDSQGKPSMGFKDVKHLSTATVNEVIRPLLATKFADIGLQSPLLPAITLPAETFLNTKVYSTSAGGYLSIFANESGAETPLPASGWPGNNEEIALCIDASVVYQRINEKLEEMKLSAPYWPAPLPDDPDTLLHEIHFSLMQNHVYVSGRMEYDGEEATFSTKVALACSGNSLVVDAVYGTKVDLPWYIDFVDFFLNKIEAAAIAAVKSSIGSLSANVMSEALPWTDVPNIPEQLFVKVNYDGGVYENSSGLALHGRNIQVSGIKPSSHFPGHRLTREVHKPSCQYGGMLHWGPKPSFSPPEQFDTVADALACGYNGCVHCLPEENVEPPAVIDVRIKVDLAIPPSDRTWASEITIALYRVDSDVAPRPVIFGLPLVYDEGVIRFGRNRAGWYTTSGDSAALTAPLQVRPGKWRIYARRGSWLGTVEVDAKAVAPRTTQNIVYAFFRYGAQGASVKVGAAPNFP